MQFAESREIPHSPAHVRVSPRELEYIALSGRHDVTHGLYKSIPVEAREEFSNKHVLLGVVLGGIDKLRKFLASSAEASAGEEKQFVDGAVKLFITSSRSGGTFPRELFIAILAWCDELSKLSLLHESLAYHDEAFALGSNRYPDLHARLVLSKANMLTTMGRFAEAREFLQSLADRPYLIPERNIFPEIIFNLGRESLLTGGSAQYKRLLFSGLRQFYTDMEDRKRFLDQLKKTFRRSYKVLLDPDVTFSQKFLFSVHWLYFRIQRNSLARRIGWAFLGRRVLLGYLYYLNYVRSNGNIETIRRERPRLHTRRKSETRAKGSRREHVLVTRAMGGLGDLLMMTPGLHELKRSHPDEEVHLAIPRRFFPLFEGNKDVQLFDIENDSFDHGRYRKWHNFTQCPAARVESRTAPWVKKTRIDIFARALGIGFTARLRMDHRPRYVVSEEEKGFQSEFWKTHGLEGKTVVGVQLRSEEEYRNYPHMESVVRYLSRRFFVVVFDDVRISADYGDNVLCVGGHPLRAAFALASACDAIVAPDSAFVHLAAALDVPCVALYGPIDGEIRTRWYPKCTFLDAREELGCVPCWRNEVIPCRLTGMRTSVCLGEIAASRVVQAVERIINRKGKE